MYVFVITKKGGGSKPTVYTFPKFPSMFIHRLLRETTYRGVAFMDFKDTAYPFFESDNYLVPRMLLFVLFFGCLATLRSEGCLNSTLVLVLL